MTIKSLALIVFDSIEADWLIEQACSLAARLDAHLTVLHGFGTTLYFDGLGGDAMIFASVQAWEDEEGAKIRAIFDAQVRAQGILAEYRRHTVLYGTEAFLLSAARGADLVLAGSNASPSRSPDDWEMMERLVRRLGRPVLLLGPTSPLSDLVGRMVIGWSDTREATRAAHDALALARPGAQIELVSVISHPGSGVPGIDSKADFAMALDRRGFVVTVAERAAEVEDRAATLLEAAREFGAELLVTGAFGHSPLYDFVIGAVSRTLMAKAPLPLLMSK